MHTLQQEQLCSSLSLYYGVHSGHIDLPTCPQALVGGGEGGSFGPASLLRPGTPWTSGTGERMETVPGIAAVKEGSTRLCRGPCPRPLLSPSRPISSATGGTALLPINPRLRCRSS